jgi:hypothetical protein
MQHIGSRWRCPWSSTERWVQGVYQNVTVVTCEWPLKEKRDVEGMPNGVVPSE